MYYFCKNVRDTEILNKLWGGAKKISTSWRGGFEIFFGVLRRLRKFFRKFGTFVRPLTTLRSFMIAPLWIRYLEGLIFGGGIIFGWNFVILSSGAYIREEVMSGISRYALNHNENQRTLMCLNFQEQSFAVFTVEYKENEDFRSAQKITTKLETALTQK